MSYEDALQANRADLNKLPDAKDIADDAHIGETSRVTGCVRIGAHTAIENCIVRGPVQIGQNCRLKDTYIGPYTTLGNDVEIVASEIENAVVHDGVRIHNLEDRIQDSIIGARTHISRVKIQPGLYQFRVGEDSFIEIA